MQLKVSFHLNQVQFLKAGFLLASEEKWMMCRYDLLWLVSVHISFWWCSLCE